MDMLTYTVALVVAISFSGLMIWVANKIDKA